MTRTELKVVTDGRFLCVAVTNLGTAGTFSGIVQPGRGTASAATAMTAMWHDSTEPDRLLVTGQTALVRIALRDRPPAAHEDDGHGHVHPEGPQAWRMCFLKKGIGTAVERVCPVVRREGSSADDAIVLTILSDGPPRVKTVSQEGNLAIDGDTNEQFRVLDSARHYHAKPLT